MRENMNAQIKVVSYNEFSHNYQVEMMEFFENEWCVFAETPCDRILLAVITNEHGVEPEAMVGRTFDFKFAK